MIWGVFILFLGVSVARELPYAEPEYLDSLRASGQDEEFARLLGIDVSLVRPGNAEERSEGSRFNNVSSLGDILLSEEQERQGINLERYPTSRWPNGRIPYYITRSDFTTSQRTFIENSITAFNSRVASNGKRVTLVPKQSNDRDYVQVISGNGCYSYLGKTGGQQVLSLQSNGCLSKGTVQHEFMHAVGFTHEHNRADRDNFVTVRFDNIPPEWQSQYEKVNEDDFKNIGKYDYYSVMHYPLNAPGTNKPAFEILTPGIDTSKIGQRDGLTDWDVYKINILYN